MALIDMGRDPSHDFALFVAFFHQLVAGPIVRAVDYIPQLALDHRWDWRRFRSGLERIAIGLGKKVVIADSLVLVVDPVYANPSAYSGNDFLIEKFYIFYRLFEFLNLLIYSAAHNTKVCPISSSV